MAKAQSAQSAATEQANVENVPTEQTEAQTEQKTEAQTFKPQSEKLTELQGKYAELFAKQMEFISNPFSEAAKKHGMLMLNVQNEIAGETSKLILAENERKLQIARNERIALNDRQIAAHAELIKAQMENAGAEKIAELQTAFDTARETVNNELLAKFAASKPAKAATIAATNGQTVGNRSNDNNDVIELFLQGDQAKPDYKAIEAATNKPRSTVWHAINKYKIANGLK